MSKEPENRVGDAQVSETYRTLARERVPEHLNARVLSSAAGKRTRYARARAWMRPAAWAATIGLSLAFVLEFSRLPMTESDYAIALPSEVSGAAGSPEAEAIRQSAPDTTIVNPRARVELTPRETTLLQDAEQLARAQAGIEKPADGALSGPDAGPADGEPVEQESMAAAAMRSAAADRQMAEDVAIEARSAAASLAALSAASTSEPYCPASERESAESWLACIRVLREDGSDDRADEEYERFQRVFPEFDDSVTDK